MVLVFKGTSFSFNFLLGSLVWICWMSRFCLHFEVWRCISKIFFDMNEIFLPTFFLLNIPTRLQWKHWEKLYLPLYLFPFLKKWNEWTSCVNVFPGICIKYCGDLDCIVNLSFSFVGTKNLLDNTLSVLDYHCFFSIMFIFCFTIPLKIIIFIIFLHFFFMIKLWRLTIFIGTLIFTSIIVFNILSIYHLLINSL